MNFTFTWIMDKLGYMPKIEAQVWDFPKATIQSKTVKIPKATTRKPRTTKKSK
jgi:hypothetical protein